MKRQELPLFSEGASETNRAIPNRYYVQCITEQVFLLRECLSPNGRPGLVDRLVRAFEFRHDADVSAHSANEKQRQLDAQYGYWAQRAL